MFVHHPFMLGFPPYEHKYTQGNTDIYACKPQYYRSKAYIKAGDHIFVDNTFMSGFLLYEHQYTLGNTDIYACEPQNY